MPKLPELLELGGADKLTAIQNVGVYFISKGFKIVDLDVQRPWGFYFYFDPAQTNKFISYFFDDVVLGGIDTSLPLQPKVLVFEPGKLNSWQYHHRRAEIWRCITRKLQVVQSPNDQQTRPKIIECGEIINFPQGERHRGGAVSDQWGAVAEIWQHTDPNHISDEADIVRIQDDFNRV